MEISYKVLDSRWRQPARGYPESAGYDVWALTGGVIPAGGAVMIRLGFATAFTPGYVAIVDDRGSTGSALLTHLAGVIDSDYRDEWMIIMANLGKEPYVYTRERAIAQVLFLRVEEPTERIVDELPPSARGKGKLGSSDKA